MMTLMSSLLQAHIQTSHLHYRTKTLGQRIWERIRNALFGSAPDVNFA